LCGAGCANAHSEIVALAERLKAPIVHALRGKEYVEWDNPYDVGMTGLIGFSSGYHAMGTADTLLILGSAFPYRAFYPAKAKIVQIDTRPEALGAHTQIDLGVIGDVKATVKALLPKLIAKTDGAYLATALEHYAKARKGLDELATAESDIGQIHPQYLATLISEKAAEDAVFTADVGTPTVWAARYLKMNGKRRLIGSFSHGSMANAMVQAIGAQALDPKRQVVALCGDGGFAMLMGDILSVRQLNLPVKIVIFHNRSLGFVAMEMKAGGYVETGTDLVATNFADIAQGAGLFSVRVETSEALDDALRAAFSHPGPALVDVVTTKHELAMPPKLQWAQAKGFSLYMLRAVLSGRGDEVVELAQTNLR